VGEGTRAMVGAYSDSSGLARLVGRLVVTRLAIRAAASSGSSCSQTLTGSQPAAVRAASVSRSRRRLFSILLCHQSALLLGHVPWSGHPCQKQPSTETATRAGPKTMSVSRRTPGIRRRWIRNRRPLEWSARRSPTSAPVLRLRCLLMREATDALAARGRAVGWPDGDASSAPLVVIAPSSLDPYVPRPFGGSGSRVPRPRVRDPLQVGVQVIGYEHKHPIPWPPNRHQTEGDVPLDEPVREAEQLGRLVRRGKGLAVR
jgi:hypothetical protein